MATGWEAAEGSFPLPPANGQALSPFQPGKVDLRWDDPALLSRNTPFTIVGVNVYRSDSSDRGPYFRVNEVPLGGSFYRDQTTNVRIRETIPWATGWRFKGDAPNDRRWVLCTSKPIVKKTSEAPFQTVSYANAPTDVQLFIDGQEVPVHDVFGPQGEIQLINIAEFNVVTEKNRAAVLPSETSTVEVVYHVNRNHVQSGLDKFSWYRLATVALDSNTPSGYTETPLGWCEPLTLLAVERLDYIWREAVRRNQWILQQGGERVKLFIRRTSGVSCGCQIEGHLREYSKQPSNRCQVCFGTGYIGGFDGPYDDIVAPDDAERRISQSQFGRRKEHTYEVWTGPSPLLTMRDFMVKQTNERYSVGAVRRPSNRGNILQQHFTIAYLDEGDIRYKVPVDGTTELPWPQARDNIVPLPSRPVDGALEGPTPWPVGPYNTTPMSTEKSGTPDTVEQRGRSRVWENQNS